MSIIVHSHIQYAPLPEFTLAVLAPPAGGPVWHYSTRLVCGRIDGDTRLTFSGAPIRRGLVIGDTLVSLAGDEMVWVEPHEGALRAFGLAVPGNVYVVQTWWKSGREILVSGADADGELMLGVVEFDGQESKWTAITPHPAMDADTWCFASPFGAGCPILMPGDPLDSGIFALTKQDAGWVVEEVMLDHGPNVSHTRPATGALLDDDLRFAFVAFERALVAYAVTRTEPGTLVVVEVDAVAADGVALSVIALGDSVLLVCEDGRLLTVSFDRSSLRFSTSVRPLGFERGDRTWRASADIVLDATRKLVAIDLESDDEEELRSVFILGEAST